MMPRAGRHNGLAPGLGGPGEGRYSEPVERLGERTGLNPESVMPVAMAK